MFFLLSGIWFVCYSANYVVAGTEQTCVQNAIKDVLDLINKAKIFFEEATKYLKTSCPVAEPQYAKPIDSASQITVAEPQYGKPIDIDSHIPVAEPQRDKSMDCAEIQERNASSRSGRYKIWPKSLIVNGSVDVYCDMDDDGGGWTVIQRRGDFGSPQDFFYQDWAAYKKGFGDLLKDFWIGNDIIFALTNQRSNIAKFSLSDWESKETYAIYDEFWIEDESHNYTIHASGYRGTAGDSMSHHNNKPFSTKDRDNDYDSRRNCASLFKGAWWFTHCHYSHLNGEYLKVPPQSFGAGVNWYDFRGWKYSLKDTIIKIRPNDFKSILTNITPQ